MKTWKLTIDLVGYFDPIKNSVTFLNKDILGKKGYSGWIKSNINSSWVKKELENKDFKLKMENQGLKIQSPEAPTQDWYLINNLESSYIFDIIQEADEIKNGDLSGVWNIVFDSKNVFEYTFVQTNSPEYKKAHSEMNRNIIYDISKKTKKWVVGHRYETSDNSFYYLGVVKSHHKVNRTFSENGERDVHIFAVDIDINKYKTISEVIKTHPLWFYEGFKQIKEFDSNYIYSDPSLTKLAVDCGEVLKNDLTTIEDLWEECICNYPKETSLREYLKLFDFTSKDSYPSSVSEKIKVFLTEKIKKALEDHILEYWDITIFSQGYNILSKDDDLIQENSLESIVIHKFEDFNVSDKDYYQKLFQKLGIDYSRLAKEALELFKNSKKDILNTPNFLSDILNNKLYYQRHFTKNSVSVIQNQTSNQTLDSLLPNYPALKTSIKEIHKQVMNSYGKCYCKNYSRYKSSVLDTQDDICISYQLDLESFAEFYGNNFPENLESELIEKKIFWINIDCFEKELI